MASDPVSQSCTSTVIVLVEFYFTMLFHGIGLVHVKGNAGSSGLHGLFGILRYLAALFHEAGRWVLRVALAHR